MSNSIENKKIGLVATTSLVSGNLIGSGVFLLPASLAAFGMVSLYGWLVTSLGALCLALIFAKLSSKHAKGSGGPHYFIQHAFGERAGFYAAWGYWCLSWISNAALVVAAVGYFSVVTGALTPFETFLIELGIIALITFLNVFGVKTAGSFQVMLTVLKLIPLIFLPVVALYFIDWSAISFAPSEGVEFWGGLKKVIFLTIWAFIGVETGTVQSRDVIDPDKTVPRATILGTFLAALVYILGTFTILALIPQNILAVSTAPYATLASTLFGGKWGIPIAIAATVCCLGAYQGWTMVVTRIAANAATDKLFPPIFALENRWGTPIFSLLLSGFMIIPLLYFSMQEGVIEQFNLIIDFSITLILVIYLLCVIAYLKSILKHGGSKWGYLLALGAFGFVTLSLWGAGANLIWSFGLLLLGAPLDYFWHRHKVSKGL